MYLKRYLIPCFCYNKSLKNYKIRGFGLVYPPVM
nr:MAG TPA: hypothetical protein [Caudoviricetes sp.]